MKLEAIRPRPARNFKNAPPVFPNGWIPVIESAQLQKGEVKALNVIGQELVAFRTEDGIAHVMDAYCPHLGANLGIMGRVVKDCIECPFHGWRFNADTGACTHVPYAVKVPDFVKATKWETHEVLGLVFVWYHADGAAPSWQLPHIEEVEKNIWRQEHRFEHTVEAHIQDIAENGADIGHFNQIHRASCFLTSEQFQQTLGNTWWGRLVNHSWQASTQGALCHTASVDVTACVSVLGTCPDFLKHRVEVLQVGPALVLVRMRSRHGGCLIVQSLTPLAPFRVHLVHRFYPEPKLPWIIRRLNVLGFRHMVERDIAVWNYKNYLKQPALVREDRSIVAFRKWFSQFYSESSPKWRDVLDASLEW
ncbi:hypothetical protein HPB50_002921 [Hyalomma asiaticum]|uniref:Uncharacterized protein n=1 Tax=Hyalomma asiaticum TaxID=266040 RepID=A0ACB7TED3_HYAAI|nr:hypothetical protein HPB50_002921 [Hyalomma asiaticum]